MKFSWIISPMASGEEWDQSMSIKRIIECHMCLTKSVMLVIYLILLLFGGVIRRNADEKDNANAKFAEIQWLTSVGIIGVLKLINETEFDSKKLSHEIFHLHRFFRTNFYKFFPPHLHHMTQYFTSTYLLHCLLFIFRKLPLCDPWNLSNIG